MRGHLIRRLSLPAVAAALTASALLPLTPANPAAAASTGSWDLVFADEFNGSSLNANKWHTCHWWAPQTCTIEPNNEEQLYTPNNVSVGNGKLKLQARKQNATAWNGDTYHYTSGMVSTGGSKFSSPAKDPGFVFRYGYVEARVKIPAGKGLWPAVWLLPDNNSWPPEIDIMEIIGDKPREANMHYHYTKSNGDYADVGKAWTGPDFSKGWHTFGVDWKPGSITWYIDGVKRFQFTGSDVTSEPSYVLLNLAVGGNWPGSPNASTTFPANYLVDYLRVYQRDGNPTGVPSGGEVKGVTTDTIRPRVTAKLRQPKPNVIRVKGKARDNVRVAKMKVVVDGKVRKVRAADAVAYNWKVHNLTPGKHVVRVKAWDTSGNKRQDKLVYRH